MNLKQFIEGQAPNEWSIEKRSGEAGTLSLRWHVLHGETDTHTEAAGSKVSGSDYNYTLTATDKTLDAAGGYDVGYSYGDAYRALSDIPCFLRRNLPGSARARMVRASMWGLTNLVSAADVLAACSTAAAQAGITLDFSGVNAGDIMVPLVDNGSTIGGVLDNLARFIPNLTTRVEGSTVTLCGGQGELTSAATYARAVVECSPDMKSGTLTVGSTVVDLAGVYAANAASLEPLNWYVNCARLICDALADCAEADAMQQGRYIFLTARVPGSAGNSIALSLTGVQAGGSAARAVVTPGEDLDAAGALTDGVNEVELEESGTRATGYLIYYVPGGQGFTVDGKFLTSPADDDVMSVEAWNAQLRAAGCPVECVSVEEATGDDEVQVNVRALVLGTAGNAITLEPDAGNSVSGETLEGGEGGGRTLGDLVEAVNDETDFPFTAAAAGAAASGSAEIAAFRNVCSVVIAKGGAELARATITFAATARPGAAELAAAINAKAALAAVVTASAEGNVLQLAAAQGGASWNGTEATIVCGLPASGTYSVTLAGGVDGSGIVLTAKAAGSAGNGIGVYASGCFGTAGQFRGGADASGVSYGVTPFSGGGGTDVRAAYDGLLGQRARQDLPEGWKITRHVVNTDAGNKAPTAVIGVTSGRLGGQNVVFKVPEDASEYQEGALVVDVDIDRTREPQVERESWEYDPTKEGARRDILRQAERANRLREDTQKWMTVKGTPIPAGLAVAGGAVKMNIPHVKDREKWQRFWAQFGAFKVLGEITEGFAFGKPYFFPIAAEEAYPTDDAPEFEEATRIGALRPPVREFSNVPANYKLLTPSDNMHLLVEGSFPASSKAGGNVGGLHFCKGCLKQYVFIDGNLEGISKEQATAFFKGSYKFKGKTRRFTCLKVEGTFIDRRRKRFQEGTNKRAPEDPDYNEDIDGGRGWHVIGERTEDDPEPQQGLSKADYIAAAKEYLAACGNMGTAGRTEEISAHVVGGDFDPGLTVDDVFAVLGMAPAASGGYSYDSSSREVTARGSAGQAANFELEDFLTRRRAVKEAAWLDWKERHKDAVEAKERERDTAGGAEPPEYPLTPLEWQAEREKDNYPMVSPSISASAGVSNEDAPLNPFQVYADGEKWFINEGEIASARYGVLKFPTTEITSIWQANRSFYVKVAPKSGGGWKLVVKYHDNTEEEEEEE